MRRYSERTKEMVVDLAARPHITAGVALASAAVLAAGPIAQHLSGLHVTQQLRQVGVSGINLTGADSVVDLFSGVENELELLVNGASAAAVPANLLSDVFSPITQNLVVNTWLTTFDNAAINLQYIANAWSKVPFSVLQQLAANGIQYASDYVSPYQTAAAHAVNFLTGTTKTSFQPLISTAITDLQTGNISAAVNTFYEAFYSLPFVQIGQPLEAILHIPEYMTQNLASATNYLVTTGLTGLGSFGFLGWPGQVEQALGTSLQTVYNSWSVGDQLGALTNLANTPGAIANALLNGTTSSVRQPPSNGLLSSPAFTVGANKGNGLINWVLNTLEPGLAQEVIAPNAQNIAGGGSLVTAIQQFANQLINGWPSLSPVVNDVSAGLTGLLQSIPSAVANLPSILGNAGAWLASNIGLLISNLLKLL
ncbi:hypothetical protein [Mycobacterium malmoense]|uniref:hypothetical protein n=1 Tax=Mycobacterium malmoense TaxID=1780 RepID=UPI0008F954F4|nr:hypothetical protein [Mycobacterium malmoense]OIN78969.1 hypothetical protein BMG05_20480 [Mycobacterium malmoense]